MDNEVVKTMMEKIDRIADYVFKKDNVPKEEAEILLTSEEAADLLKISTRTLQRMRKDKTIPYMMVRSKCRYRLTDLEECVRRKIVHCNPKTLEEFQRIRTALPENQPQDQLQGIGRAGVYQPEHGRGDAGRQKAAESEGRNGKESSGQNGEGEKRRQKEYRD